MSRWPHDDPASLAAFYGDPAKDEPGRQLVPVIPPFQMYYEGKPVKQIQFISRLPVRCSPRSMRSGSITAATRPSSTRCGSRTIPAPTITA